MSPREAFRVFIKFQLMMMVEDAKIELTSDEITKFIQGVEDDQTFYEKLEDFLAEYIEDFGENYGL